METEDARVKTYEHIMQVAEYLLLASQELQQRILKHDQSKLGSVESDTFQAKTAALKDLTYDSPEYRQCLADMKPALDHHYRENRHHPEHFKNGVNDMNLFDVLEMVLDWKAATLRHNDGNIRKSIEANRVRFNLSDQLAGILENTIVWLENK